MYPEKLTSTSQSSTSVHLGRTAVELSKSPVKPLLSSTPLTTVKNTQVGIVASHLADTATVDLRLTGSPNISEQPSNRIIRRALPGMVAPERPGTTAEFLDQSLPGKKSVSNEGESTSKPSNAVLSGERPFDPMPPRHPRIPSTGNRATIIDVAQVLSIQSPEPESASEAQPWSSMPAAANQLRNLIPSAVHMEKRKSNQEKYSAIMLPSLKEETTPTDSPAGTLSHGISKIHQHKLVDEVFGKPGLGNIGEVDVSRTSVYL
jgi:hypothetical protein